VIGRADSRALFWMPLSLWLPTQLRPHFVEFCADTLGVRPYSDEKVANRDIRVWHGVTENGPEMMNKSKTPRHDCISCRYLTFC
jgi:hypothetical protein